MFRKNQHHLQPALISNVTTCRRSCVSGWKPRGPARFGTSSLAGCRKKRSPSCTRRSTVAQRTVNVLVSLDTLKGGFGWSDEELYDKFCYDLQVRYAVGYDNLATVSSSCARCTTFGGG